MFLTILFFLDAKFIHLCINIVTKLKILQTIHITAATWVVVISKDGELLNWFIYIDNEFFFILWEHYGSIVMIEELHFFVKRTVVFDTFYLCLLHEFCQPWQRVFLSMLRTKLALLVFHVFSVNGYGLDFELRNETYIWQVLIWLLDKILNWCMCWAFSSLKLTWVQIHRYCSLWNVFNPFFFIFHKHEIKQVMRIITLLLFDIDRVFFSHFWTTISCIKHYILNVSSFCCNLNFFKNHFIFIFWLLMSRFIKIFRNFAWLLPSWTSKSTADDWCSTCYLQPSLSTSSLAFAFRSRVFRHRSRVVTF